MIALLRLLRPWQWYKNLVIGLALVFTGMALVPAAYHGIILGFLILCAISSANYIINDLHDRKEDRRNPEKRDRPLASGKVTPVVAVFLAVILLVVGFGGSFLIHPDLLVVTVGLFVLTSLYTFVLKHEAFADILAIATNFVLRALAGAIILQVPISGWLIVGTFFFALFLATGKRTGEVLLLKDKGVKHRRNLSEYTPEMSRFLMIISTTLLIISYALYVFLGHGPELIITLPFMLYAVLRYLSLVESGSRIARHPHLAITDKRLFISGLVFCVLCLVLII